MSVTASYQPRRLSVPLSAKDQEDLALIRGSIDSVPALPGELNADSSDAALVHAVFVAGLRALREEAAAEGYAQLARDPEWVEYQRAARGNRRSRGDQSARATGE